jgi:hypothetical protein
MEANDTQNISINQIIAQVRHDIEAVNIAGVMKAWDLFRSRFPTEVEGCLTIGFLLREAGKPDEAEMVFSDTMARFPDNVWAAVPHAAIPALRRPRPDLRKLTKPAVDLKSIVTHPPLMQQA